MKDGGIEPAQSYGAGSAGNAMSERNVLGFRHTKGSERSLPNVRVQSKRGAAREERSDMDEDQEADTAWGECWGVRMSVVPGDGLDEAGREQLLRPSMSWRTLSRRSQVC
jgi:hypothetical protein